MSAIRDKATKPELAIRRALHAAGFRYRVNLADLPGKPDLVMRRYKSVVFINGCFWHGHNCHLFKLPSQRRDFWQSKILSNKLRDQAVCTKLHEKGWRTATVWECAMKGKFRRDFGEVIAALSAWIRTDVMTFELASRPGPENSGPDLLTLMPPSGR